MTDQSIGNSMWQARVKDLLKRGYGVEDIGVMLGCDPEHVRIEVRILRETGELDKMFRRGL